MTLFQQISTWSEAAQEEFVQSIATIEHKHLGVYRLDDDDEREAVRRGLREMREGKLASDEEIASVFALYRSWRVFA